MYPCFTTTKQAPITHHHGTLAPLAASSTGVPPVAPHRLNQLPLLLRPGTVVRLVPAATPTSVRAGVEDAVPQWEEFVAKEDVVVGKDTATGVGAATGETPGVGGVRLILSDTPTSDRAAVDDAVAHPAAAAGGAVIATDNVAVGKDGDVEDTILE